MTARLSDMLTNYLQDDDLAPGVKVGMIELTPAIAADFLARVPKRQRKKTERTIKKYVADLKAGAWPFLADVIRFNYDDELIDGQHRCQAVLDSGISIQTLVVFGLEPEAIVPMDSGLTRTFQTLLEMEEHVENAGVVAALTLRVWHWTHGNYGEKGIARVISPQYLGVTPSVEQLWVVYRGMKDELVECSKHGASLSRYFRRSAGPAVFAFSWMLLRKLDLDEGEAFFWALKNNQGGVGPEMPLNQLNRKLTQMPIGDKKPRPWVFQHLIFQTWNRKHDGVTTGLRKPPFPAFNTVAIPADPNKEVREPGWEPIPNAFGVAL